MKQWKVFFNACIVFQLEVLHTQICVIHKAQQYQRVEMKRVEMCWQSPQ